MTVAVCSIGCGSKGSSVVKTFCDTACLKDSLKFTGDHKLKPYVYITVKNCGADSIIWSYKGMGVNRKTGFTYLLGTSVRLNKDYIRCFIKDTAFALLLFNDCVTGRGFQLRLPFNKIDDIGRSGSGINNFDHKFAVADNMIAYTDRGNIFVEDIDTGKKAMMTFGKATGIEYNAIHETIDSVNITSSRIWVKVKIDNEWKELEKKIILE
jgi:hypothetical protein